MPLLKFRIYWEEDDTIYRDIVVQSGQTFLEFKDALLKALEFKEEKSSVFYVSNDKWALGRAISSEVLVNKKDAPALSMLKTPVSALVEKPDQKFIWVFDPVKEWTFQIILIGIERDYPSKHDYPLLVRSEGIAPILTRIHGVAEQRLMEVEEKYDMNREDMDEEGYSDEDGDDAQEEEDNGNYEDIDLF